MGRINLTLPRLICNVTYNKFFKMENKPVKVKLTNDSRETKPKIDSETINIISSGNTKNKK